MSYNVGKPSKGDQQSQRAAKPPATIVREFSRLTTQELVEFINSPELPEADIEVADLDD